jgi:hypothetical protein
LRVPLTPPPVFCLPFSNRLIRQLHVTDDAMKRLIYPYIPGKMPKFPFILKK